METQHFNSQTEREQKQQGVYTALPPTMHLPKRPRHWSMLLKVLLIGFLTLLLLIPMFMIEGLIKEREDTANNATNEVHHKWSGSQTILGPVLTIPYYEVRSTDNTGKVEKVLNVINILPETLKIKGEIQTKNLKRGLYEIVVYDSPIELTGTFILPDELNLSAEALNDFLIDEAMLNIGISDLRGINEQVTTTFGQEEQTFNPGIRHNQLQSSLISSGVSCNANIRPLFEKRLVSFSVKLFLKGSESLYFAPLGKTTEVALESNSLTPSFTGAFLPTHREVTDKGFTSRWKVMHLNRNYPQVLTGDNWKRDVEESVFGTDMLIPVQHYQKSMRSVKYAMLIILLTFVVCFFVEVLQKKRIHPFQYLLIGLALSLFYSLLVSISEHLDFTIAYAVSSVMTVSLITLYMAGMLKIKKTALTIGGLLSGLYVYIFILIQMETYALLAGSLGLFIILAIIMYVSQRINWNDPE